MNITGIICEYNPFHNGHLYHIEQTRELCDSDYIIGIMSGCFTQRGAAAITDKYIRTEMALTNGCDLVIELPVRYSTSSAEGFAHASINTLAATNICNSFCFGSEQGNLDGMTAIAQILNNEPNEYKDILSKELKKGLSYPSARENALSQYISHKENIPEYTPNNILAIEYIRASLKTSLTPYTIKRTDNGYHSNEPVCNLCSASAIRNKLNNDDNINNVTNYVPYNPELLSNRTLDSEDFALILYSSLIYNIDILEEYMDMTPELATRIRKNITAYRGWDSFIQLIKTKGFTYTRIQRALLHCMLGIKKIEDYPIPYIRVLGFKRDASELMKQLQEKANIPVITKVARANQTLDSLGRQLINEDIRATELYRQTMLQKYPEPLNNFTLSNEYTYGIIIK